VIFKVKRWTSYAVLSVTVFGLFFTGSRIMSAAQNLKYVSCPPVCGEAYETNRINKGLACTLQMLE